MKNNVKLLVKRVVIEGTLVVAGTAATTLVTTFFKDGAKGVNAISFKKLIGGEK